MRKVLTDIEKLDGHFPGLSYRVKKWLDRGTRAADIPQLLHDQYGVAVTETAVENFRAHRWAPEKERTALKKETTQAAVDAFGGDSGFDMFLLAKLWELMDKMTIPQLLSARSLFVRIKAQNLKEQEFLFKTGQLKPGQASGGQEVDREAQSRNALRRIKEIFGLAGDVPPAPPVRQIPAAIGQESA